MRYVDHFGKKSSDYLQYRPDYPDELYQYLVGLATQHELAWDCGTGNGQAAGQLSPHFKQVIGSDVNQQQLDVAIKKANVHYYCWPAEKTGLSATTVDLVTVAQALHWFNLEPFYQEVQRVSKSSGIMAAWCYSLGSINQEIDMVIKKLYTDILGNGYWPSERRYIDEQYQTIYFPFKKMETPQFNIEKKMDFTHVIGYLNTWSAVKEYQQVNQDNPIHLIYADLQKVWGEPSTVYTMRWPIHLLVGHVG